MNEETTPSRPHRATFQLILKKPVYPPFYLAEKLLSSVQAKASAIGDYEIETVKEWITVRYYTSYNEVPKRILLGFTIQLPLEINEAISRRIIESDADEEGHDSFGSLIQADTENVEALFRYEDDNLIKDINKYHPEIFELEMKLREVLNYILCYNLKNHNVFDFIREFGDIHIKSHTTLERIKAFKRVKSQIRDKTEKENLRHPFSFDYENELFHLVLKDYLGFTSPKKRDPRALKEQIGKARNIDELKDWLKKTVNFAKLNEEHSNFIKNIRTRVKPIEELRNDIMHNRKISLVTIESFESAKTLMLNWISSFWVEELNPVQVEDTRKVDSFRQAEFILNALLKTIEFERESSYSFLDLNLERQFAFDLEDLNLMFSDIINENLDIANQDELESLVRTKLEELGEI